MKRLLLPFFVFLSFTGIAQVSNYFYGLARNNNPAGIYLATVDPATGVVSNISSTSVAASINLTGAALDPYNSQYYFIDQSDIKTIDLTSGVLLNSVPVNNPLLNSYFDNFRFNNSDTTLYGLARRNVYDSLTMSYIGEMYLATINTITGIVTEISPASIGQGFALAGSAIDPYQKVYYYSTGDNLVGLDMYNGAIYSNVPIGVPIGAHFDNFTYSCADTALYGLVRQNYFDTIFNPLDPTQYTLVLDSATIRLGKIDPSTGIVTIISPASIGQGGYSLNAGSAIDPVDMTYYYNNGSELVGVSLLTGLIVSQQALTNQNGQYFDLMRIPSNCRQATAPIRLNTATSITSVTEISETVIYPNPATNYISIKNSGVIHTLRVFNTAGSVVLEKQPEASSYELNIDELPKGIYFLRCSTDRNTTTSKIVK